jgi:3-phenylpropionate/trans-cinnamate dioxygenase ferredoxin reductase subunit
MVRTVDVLLVGGGVASVRCARTLRREGFAGTILLAGEEAVAPYNRPPLSKELLRGDLPDDLVAAEPATWYDRRSVELRTGTAVEAIDLGRREATLSDGETVRLDRCLLATGASPRRLGVPGAGHAILLRTLADAHRVRTAAVRAGAGAPVVVIGGSFIGIEVASSLAHGGLRPTVVELGDRLWSGRLGDELAAWAADRLHGAGIALRLGAVVDRIDSDGAWIGDERLPAALVVAGVGVRPRDEIAREAALEVDDGIVVGEDQRTSHPIAWAAGDVARRGPLRIEHWHAAREGGERAARGMLGLPIPDAPEPWLFSEVAGTSLDVVGAAAGWDAERWIDDGRVLAYVVAGRLVQLASIGSAMPPDQMRGLVGRRAPIAEVASAARALGPRPGVDASRGRDAV